MKRMTRCIAFLSTYTSCDSSLPPSCAGRRAWKHILEAESLANAFKCFLVIWPWPQHWQFSLPMYNNQDQEQDQLSRRQPPTPAELNTCNVGRAYLFFSSHLGYCQISSDRISHVYLITISRHITLSPMCCRLTLQSQPFKSLIGHSRKKVRV